MALLCTIKVVPSSGRSICIIDKNGMLKCFLKNPPEKGKANKELITMLADALSVAKNKVSIISGLTSRIKRVKIDLNIDFGQLLEKLGIERQQKLF